MSAGPIAWLWLLAAICCEVVATSTLKAASAHPNALNISIVAGGYITSFVALAAALRAGIQVGAGYAIWSGVGTTAIAVIGVVALGESVSLWKFVFIGVIIIGVVGLNLVGGHHA